MEPAIDLTKKKLKFKPSMVLHEGKTFIAIDGEPDVVVQCKTIVDKVSQYLEEGGQPVIDPKSHQLIFSVESRVEIKLIPRNEFDDMRRATWGLQ